MRPVEIQTEMDEDESREYDQKIGRENVDYVIKCYNSGFSCTKVSILSGVPFSIVYEIISGECSSSPRI
jgi:hypothetical protein